MKGCEISLEGFRISWMGIPPVVLGKDNESKLCWTEMLSQPSLCYNYNRTILVLTEPVVLLPHHTCRHPASSHL